MQERGIDASLSTNNLTFRPGGAPVSFEITVFNASERFADFNLELLAAGANRNSSHRWYNLSPEVAAANPPGSSTVFQIAIFDTPIPGFVGAVNLTVRIFSPQLREERKLIVRLTIEPGTGRSLLQVILPVQQFKVYPRNVVDIPVQVRNLSPYPTEVVLRFTRLNPTWLVNSSDRRLSLGASSAAVTIFQCQPPVATQAPSQIYPFTIIVLVHDSSTVEYEAYSGETTVSPHASAEGSLEVLPVGFVEFTTKNPKQTIPMRGSWLPDWKSQSATFELLFKNASNLRQQLNLQVQGEKQRSWKYKVVPDVTLKLGETTCVQMETIVKRHWLGLAKTLRLEVKAVLSDQRLGSTDPATQSLELRILPIVPLWLLLAVLAILAALLALLLKPEAIAHTANVNALSFKGGIVLSGSDDCTIRRWKIGGDRLQPLEQLEDNSLGRTCQGKALVPSGLLAVTEEPVWSLQVLPDESNRVAAGLSKGGIALWDITTGELDQTVTNSDKDVAGKTDRLYDLTVTRKALYLFSGYASGQVRVWKRTGINEKFQPSQSLSSPPGLEYVIRALALSPDENNLVVAGEENNLIVWDRRRWQAIKPQRPKKLLLSDKRNQGRQDNIFHDIAFLPNSPNVFVTADSGGFITVWDLDQCKVIATSADNNLNQPIVSQCQERDRWQASNLPVRSLDFSQDGLQLVSAGNEGKVLLWTLTHEGKLDEQAAPRGREYKSPDGHQALEIYSTQRNQALFSVKLIPANLGKRQATIVSGGEDSENGYFQVKLHPIP